MTLAEVKEVKMFPADMTTPAHPAVFSCVTLPPAHLANSTLGPRHRITLPHQLGLRKDLAFLPRGGEKCCSQQAKEERYTCSFPRILHPGHSQSLSPLQAEASSLQS